MAIMVSSIMTSFILLLTLDRWISTRPEHIFAIGFDHVDQLDRMVEAVAQIDSCVPVNQRRFLAQQKRSPCPAVAIAHVAPSARLRFKVVDTGDLSGSGMRDDVILKRLDLLAVVFEDRKEGVDRRVDQRIGQIVRAGVGESGHRRCASGDAPARSCPPADPERSRQNHAPATMDTCSVSSLDGAESTTGAIAIGMRRTINK